VYICVNVEDNNKHLTQQHEQCGPKWKSHERITFDPLATQPHYIAYNRLIQQNVNQFKIKSTLCTTADFVISMFMIPKNNKPNCNLDI